MAEESIALGRESGDVSPVIQSMHTLALVYAGRGDFGHARQVLEESARLEPELGLLFMVPFLYVALGDLDVAEGDLEAAERNYRWALEAASRGTTRAQMATAVRHYAGLCLARGDHGRAVRLLSAGASVAATPTRAGSDWLPGVELSIATARSTLGNDEFAREWAAGQSLTLEQAILEALR